MRALKWIAIVLVVLIAAAVAALMTIDVNRFKPEIVSAVENATGRKLEIAGDLKLSLFPIPGVSVKNVSFANASWGSRPAMATIGEFAVQPELLPLLHQQIVINRLVLTDVDLVLEKNRQGQANWEFTPKQAQTPAAPKEQKDKTASKQVGNLPVISDMQMKNIKIAYRDAQSGTQADVALSELSVKEVGDDQLATKLVAVVNGQAIEANGTLGSLAELTAPSRPWPIKMTVSIPNATANVDGTIAQPLQAKGIALKFSADIGDLAKLAASFGSSAPAIPVKLQGQVRDSGPQRYALTNLTANIADSDLSGGGEIALGGARPSLKFDLASKSFDIGPLMGQPGSGKGGGNAPAGSGTSGGAKKAEGRLFSDDPLPLDGLKAVDAEIAYKAEHFKAPKLDAQNLMLNASLKDGVLNIKPLSFGVAGGNMKANVALNGGAKTLVAKVDATGLMLADYLQKNGVSDVLSRGGATDVNLDVTSKGASMHQLMAGLNGKAILKVGEGELKEEYMRSFLPELADAVGVLGRATAKTQLYCVVSGIDIKDGVATSKALLAETGRITIAGDGNVNLGTEQVDMRLVPSSRSVSVGAALPPIRVRGTLSKPSFAPDPAALAKSVIGTAAGIAALGPLAILSPALGVSGGDDSKTACDKATALAEGRQVQQPAPSKQQQPGNAVENLKKGLGNLLGR
ncbi:MAG TPA: AsmA family protein [Ferrovibrio sp.]|uniref:AsmA family protein n=1 Tax=Ferrovibrio sp. TaxID=1917215 RepID=UPI002ED5E181